MTNKQKLELTWIGKEHRPKLEPRILLEDPALTHHAAQRVSDNDIFDNMLIQGDNLLALKALEAEYAGKIKCVYIDPPYNTGQALDHYDDGLEHSLWLLLMRERFESLWRLLRADGIFLCQLNDDEMAYAKVLLDEVFGRSNFLNHVSVRMKQTAGASGGGEDKRLKKNIEHILIYTKDKDGPNGFVKFNDVYDEEDLFEVIEEMRSEGKSWKYTRALIDFGKKTFFTQIQDGSGEPIDIYIHEDVVMKPISALAQEEGLTEQECYKKYFDRIFRDTNAQSSIRTRVMDVASGHGDFFSIEYIPRSGRRKSQKTTLYYKGANCDLIAWLNDVAIKKGDRLIKLEKAGTYWEGFPLNNLTKEGGVLFPKGKKPEALLQKVLDLCTNPGDLVLDSFAGSGTTGAVAQKMGRRWIMVELGEHAVTHIVPRLRKVIDGADPGGVTKAVDWPGGGGFRFYRLAPSLLEQDRWGRWVINKQYNAAMLAEALCKLEGFSYGAERHALLAARPLHRARLYLCHHRHADPRAAPAARRRGRAGSQPAGAVQRLPWWQQLPQPDAEEDPAAGTLALRVGPRRLLAAGGEFAQSAAAATADGPVRRRSAGAAVRNAYVSPPHRARSYSRLRAA